jgi:hypothetical protein
MKLLGITIFFLVTGLFFVSHDCIAQSEADIINYNNYLNSVFEKPSEYFRIENANELEMSRQLLFRKDSNSIKNGYLSIGLNQFYNQSRDSSFYNFKKALGYDSACYLCYSKMHFYYLMHKNDYAAAKVIWQKAYQQFEKKVLADSLNINNWD